MTAINFSAPKGTQVVLVKDMPQTTKPVIFRRFPSFVDINRRSAAMLKAQVALTEAAINHRNDFGKVQMPNGTVISKAAVDIGADLRGQNYGGLSYLERLQKRHATAEMSLARLKKALEGKTGTGRFGRAE